ncbi:MAG TPA: putative N-acetylmannosamine-6-phosphate 2-epimerase [Micromonosporaceae bacterium]
MTSAVPEPLTAIRGGLVVSCQAQPGDPLRDPRIMARMAEAAVRAGAAGVRVNGTEDVRLAREAVPVPVIGLWKDGEQGVYITPTAEHALAVARAGAHIVAVDGTGRSRPDRRPLSATVEAVHRQTDALVLADVSTVDDALAAVDAGADAVATTLSGYTGGDVPTGPDLDLVAQLARKVPVPVIAEGRIHTPRQAREALDAGAWAVVVGSAITSPTWLTRQYVEALG